MMLRVSHFKHLGYTALFNTNTGFFARVPDSGMRDPFWSPHGPELMDVSITNWCDKGCSFCYKRASRHGRHMALADYKKLIDQAAEMGVFQVALGGGNPNQHPNFVEILSYTKAKGIIPNYTTNGRGLTEMVLETTKQTCGAVAVSAYPPYSEMSEAILAFSKHRIKTNIHFILDAQSIATAIRWLHEPPNFLRSINAIVFLNYKPAGREVLSERLLRHSDRLDEFFQLATSTEHGLKVGFDACCVSGVFARTNACASFVDACDAGRFSLYVSEDLRVYPCSFQVGLAEGDSLDHANSLLNIWTKSKNMNAFREYFSSNRCGACTRRPECMNGCPLFDELAICGNR